MKWQLAYEMEVRKNHALREELARVKGEAEKFRFAANDLERERAGLEAALRSVGNVFAIEDAHVVAFRALVATDSLREV